MLQDVEGEESLTPVQNEEDLVPPPEEPSKVKQCVVVLIVFK